MSILIPLLMYFDYSIKNFYEKFQFNKLVPIFISTTIIISAIYISYDINSDTIHESQYNLKKHQYILEKIHRFYSLRNELVIIPKFENNIGEIYPYTREAPDEDIRDYINDYNKRIYKYNKTPEYIFEDKNKALKKFYEKGGTFSNEELKNLNYSRLFDAKFVLNEIEY